MTAEIIEGEAIEVERALVPVQPGQALVSNVESPVGMIGMATQIANALSDVVERRKLYTVIQGKKYPQVEAWMTIGRMDNVVAREAQRPIRNEDGSYEAFVELIRLSDGMVIGSGSALCGTPDDKPWNSRSEPNRRSMAVTRATSRAFRQQYSWIMALAGYEPTPADEMPHKDDLVELNEAAVPPMRPPLERRAEGLTGEVKIGGRPADLQYRETPDGGIYGFKLTEGRHGFQCVAEGELANTLAVASPPLAAGDRVTVYGSVEMVPWEKDGKQMPPYSRVHLEKVQGPEWTVPA